jgi:hypothetical protein
MLPVVIGSVRDIEMAHHFLKVSRRSFDKEMEMIGHQDIGQDLGLINIAGAFQKIKKCGSVGIV